MRSLLPDSTWVVGIARPLGYLLVFGALISIAAVFSGLVELSLLFDIENGRYLTEESAIDAIDSSDRRQLIVGLLQIITYLLSSAVFLTWVYRANKNVSLHGATGLEATPGWAVLVFFIPILNLWKPYAAMSELWRASRSPGNWALIDRGGIVALWWVICLSNMVISNASFRLSFADIESIEQATVASSVSVVADVLDVLNYLVTYVLISQITEFQRDLRMPLR